MMREHFMNDQGPAMDGMDIYMRIEGLKAGVGRINSFQYETGLTGEMDKENVNRLNGIRSLLTSILAVKV